MNWIFKNVCFLLLLMEASFGLQLDYFGIKNKEEAEINENEQIVFSCSTDNNDINNNNSNGISFINPRNTYDARVVYEIINDNNTKTLIKKNATFGDSGWYGCSDSEDNKIYIFIWVKSINHFFVTNTFEVTSEFQFGSLFFIPCIPTSKSYDVQLFINSEEITIDDSDDVKFDPQAGFSIKNKNNIRDAVDFTCSITNYGRTESIIYHLTDKPKYASVPKIDTNQPVINVIKGKDIRINCSTFYDSTQQYFNNIIYWSKIINKNKTLKSKRYHSILENLKTTVELRLSNVNDNDAGEYQCIVKDFNGKKSTSVSLAVHESDTLVLNLTTPKQFYVSKINKLVILKVNIISYSNVTITWYHPDGYEIFPSNSADKYEIHNNNQHSALSINNFQINDAGNYTMKATISNNNLSKTMEKFISIPLVVSGQPVIKKMNSIQSYYMINDVATMYCYVIGYPAPKIYWFFEYDNGVSSITDIIKTKTESKLVEQNSTSEWNIKSSGYLTCQACINNNCSDKKLKISLIDISDGFGIIKNDSSTTVGDRFKATCLASIYIYNDVNWYYQNGTKVVSNNDIIITNKTTDLSHQSSIIIESVPDVNTLVYTCEGKTMENNTNKKIEMNITIYDPSLPFFIDTNMNGSSIEYDSSTAGSIEFNCYASGHPVPSIKWFKDHQTLSLTNDTCEYNMTDNNQKLIIKYSYNKKCIGTYSCVVENRVGKIERYQIIKFKNDYPIILISLLFVFILIILIFWIIIISIKRRNEKLTSLIDMSQFLHGKLSEINPELTLGDQIDCLPYDKRWEFPSDKLVLGKKLGSGAFGVVLKAEAYGITDNEEKTTVAVKMVKQLTDPSNVMSLASELKIMIHLGKHVNIVNLLGACTKNITNKELYVIVEYCRYGNLHNYLQRNRNKFINQIDDKDRIDRSIGRTSSDATKNSFNQSKYNEMLIHRSNARINSDNNEVQYSNSSSESTSLMNTSSSSSTNDSGRTNYRGDYKDNNLRPICTDDLVLWAFQVARGMEYLSQRKVLHGDLAARNILLTDGNIVKICDFGLAKSIYKNGIYEKKSDSLLPIKWMAIESMRDHIFSTQSDVWSFGIFLWELFTLGQTPYPGMDARTQYIELTEGYRLEKPLYSTTDIYEIMIRCWNEIPKYRPNFTHLVTKLSNLLDEDTVIHYINLNIPFLNLNSQLFDNGNKDYLLLMTAPDHEVVSTFDTTLSPLKIDIDDNNDTDIIDDYYLTPIDVEARRKKFVQNAAKINDVLYKKNNNLTYYNTLPLKIISKNKINNNDDDKEMNQLVNENDKNNLKQKVGNDENNNINENTPMMSDDQSVFMTNPIYMVNDCSSSSVCSTYV